MQTFIDPGMQALLMNSGPALPRRFHSLAWHRKPASQVWRKRHGAAFLVYDAAPVECERFSNSPLRLESNFFVFNR